MYKNKFVVFFKGVRGSYPTPEKEFLSYGGNTACVYVIVNNHKIILDAGSGITNAGKKIIEDNIVEQNKSPLTINILLSHLHMDHIQGLPFFTPLYFPNANINLYGPSENDETLKNDISSLIFGQSFPLSVNEIKSNFNIKSVNSKNNDNIIILKDNNPIPVMKKMSEVTPDEITENDVVISSFYSKTHPKIGVMVYKIEYMGKSIVYATDKESYSGGDKILSIFARNADLLIHDAQYSDIDYYSVTNSKQGFGHSTFEMAIEEKENAHAKSLAFFHYEPSYTDEKLDEIYKGIINRTEGLVMSAENQEITIL